MSETDVAKRTEDAAEHHHGPAAVPRIRIVDTIVAMMIPPTARMVMNVPNSTGFMAASFVPNTNMKGATKECPRPTSKFRKKSTRNSLKW